VPYQTPELYSGLDGDQSGAARDSGGIGKGAAGYSEGARRDLRARYLSSVQPFSGIRDVFRILTESDARVALATDCKGSAFKRYISLLNANEFIAATRMR
jgi:hypothetical protein